MSEDNFDDQFDDDENFDDLDDELDEFDEEVEENKENVENPETEEDDFDANDQFDDDGDLEDDEEFDANDQFDDDDSGEDEDFDKPVAEGDVVEVEVEDLGSKGDGIARVEGFVVFVPGAEVGESYDVEVTSVGRKFAFAEIRE